MRSSLLLTVASTVGLALAAPSPAPVPAPAPGAGAVSESGLNLADPALDPALLTAAFSSSPAPNTLSKRAYATTANELVDGTPCRAVTVIYARGTTQNGNIGDAGDVGPMFLNNLSSIVGANKLAVQGVDYDADIAGFLGNLIGAADKGVVTMADLVTRASTQCPSTKIVTSGYSQGGQLVHDSADLFKSNTTVVNQVAAVMIFGDPLSGDAVGSIPAAKVKVICHDGDDICDGGVLVLPPHLNYQQDAQAAAQFVASKVK